MSAAACFDFGGVAVGFDCDSAPWLRALGERYAGFETTAAASFDVHYIPLAPETGEAARGPMPPAIRRVRAHDLVEMLGPGFAASVDLRSRAAEVSGPASVYPVDMLLRELLPALAGKGIVVHGALLADRDAAWACCGPSGSGKSTLAALLPQRALCDELALLSVDREHVLARSLPFWEARPGGARLAGVAILQHGAAHRRTRLAPEQALRELAAEVVWPSFPDGAVEAAFGALAELVAAVPVWALEFLPRADVWDVITAEA